MGNTQPSEKQHKTGKSPAKSKHFMRNLNRKSSGKESKKNARKKSIGKREITDKEFDKTSESDNNETIEASDNDTVECVFKTSNRGEGGAGRTSVQSEVTVTRCEQYSECRSPTRDQLPAASPADPSSSDSVFTDPLTPLAVELNQCYYSAESDSAPEELPLILTPCINAPAQPANLPLEVVHSIAKMPHDDTGTPMSFHDSVEKEEKVDTFDEGSDKDNETVMGGILSKSREETLARKDHECNHEFLENRLKACPGQTSFTISRHRKVELPPVADTSLNILDEEKDERNSSVSDLLSDSNVLRKVASLTLDKHTESRVVRPKFVPEKLDFQLYEKFEAQGSLIDGSYFEFMKPASSPDLKRVNEGNDYLIFNYLISRYQELMLLGQNRSAKKRIRDIVTLLGLHTDDVAIFSAVESKSRDKPRELLRANSALVLYVTKKLRIHFVKPLSWLKLAICMNGINIDMVIEWDLKTRVITVLLCNKQRRMSLRIINVACSSHAMFSKQQPRQMLLNWFASSTSEDNHLRNVLSSQDLKTLGIQYCTHLLAAGVLRQITDKDAPTENIFKPNLMYYWSHMEMPASQPVTPGRLDMSSWPPERDTFTQKTQQQDSSYCIIENQYNKQNNEEINNMTEARVVISQLKRKLQEMEYEIENFKISAEISVINKKLHNSFMSTPENLSNKNKIELVSKEIQTANGSYLDRLADKPVINYKDANYTSADANDDSRLELSRLGHKHELYNNTIVGKPETRSEKIENYCKLNKSRDNNKSYWSEDITNISSNNNKICSNLEKEILIMNLTNINQHLNLDESSINITCESSSDASFVSTTAELLSNNSNKSIEFNQKNDVANINNSSSELLFSINDLKEQNFNRQSSSPDVTNSFDFVNKILPTHTDDKRNDLYTESKITISLSKTSKRNECQTISPPPPPLPGMLPSPPPMPGTIESELISPKSDLYYSNDQLISLNNRNKTESTRKNNDIVIMDIEKSSIDESPISKENLKADYSNKKSNELITLEECNLGSLLTTFEVENSITTSRCETLSDILSDSTTFRPATPKLEHTPTPNNAYLPPISEMVSPNPLLEIGTLLPSVDPLFPPTSGIGPPPPQMPETEDSLFAMSLVDTPPSRMPDKDLQPMPSMNPPLPPMPGMGPPPPPLPGMGPPSPSMPGMGPPPPPMPGMGPPPPPMPGLGPPPPPMPGMGPPPPPMPGMGPPPPPMPGMGPPPPPMPGMGPPPPPISGMGPPPPPMPGIGLPPPPMVGLEAPAPLTPGVPPPPPIAVGPVPFPAPPVGGWNMQRATLRKTPIKPVAPMKPLYWTRILATPAPPSYQSEPESSGFKPLWLEIEEAKLDNIDEFADLFSRQVIKAPVKKKVELKTKIQPIKILDSKRSQNVGILAQSLHVEFSEIENAIYNFDTSVVSLEALQQIYELRAKDEELVMIKEHLKTKSDVPLDKPEAFLHDLSGIHNFAERISCFTFQAEFDDAANTIMHKLDNLKHTCEFLVTNESLKQLFGIILALGNYMNGGNGQRGQADGFGLEILSKLRDVKSKESHITLLHFIVRTYMRVTSLGALPVPEPGDVARAAAIDFAEVANSLATLRTNLDECSEKVEKVIETDAQIQKTEDESASCESKKRLEVFKDKMTTFLNAAEEKLKTENENLCECKYKFISTVKFYQYSPKCGKVEECEPKEFFALWTTFCSDFKDIYKKEEQIAIKERLKENKKLQCERKANTQPKKEGGLKSRLQKLSSIKK